MSGTITRYIPDIAESLQTLVPGIIHGSALNNAWWLLRDRAEEEGLEFFCGSLTKDIRFAGLISDTSESYFTIRLTSRGDVIYQVNGNDALSLPDTARAAWITSLYAELATQIDEYLNLDADSIARARASHPSSRRGKR